MLSPSTRALRSGEFQELTLGDVNDHKHGLCIFVDGKTGQRDVTLIPSVPYLQRWLTTIPRLTMAMHRIGPN